MEQCALIRRMVGLALTALALQTLGCTARDEQTYEARGVVESVNRDLRQVMIAHEEIPGLMDAMTMNLDVERVELLDGVHPGARVQFTLTRGSGFLRITRLEVLEGGDPTLDERLAASPPDEPAADFELLDHEGKVFRLRDLRGHAVLLDFIFTRCTGPCPILTTAHARLQRKIPDDLAERTRFVSVSIDPLYDTPRRLRAYAETRGADLDTWWFLTGSPEDVKKVLSDYYMAAGKNPDGTLIHTVATYLIDPHGMVAQRYVGLDHSEERVLADLRSILKPS